MPPEEDALDKAALDLVASDLELLELSINDLVVALGGETAPATSSYLAAFKAGRLFDCFSRKARNERTYRCYRQFRGLDLQVDSFFRILKLHVDRGFAFLARQNSAPGAVRLVCLCYVDLVFDLYYGVAKQVISFTLHDCVYLYKFFLRLDCALARWRIKHVYIRDEIYDLTLHSLWFALKDAWWLYLSPRLLRPLLPFVAHMRVDGCHDLTVHDLNHVLHNVNFVTLISQDITFHSETSTLVDSASHPDELEPFSGPPQAGAVNFEDLEEGGLEIKYTRSVEAQAMLERDEAPAAEPAEADQLATSAALHAVLDIERHLRECEPPEAWAAGPNWAQVIYVALVGCLYVLLFESYLNVVAEGLDASASPRRRLEFLVKRLEDLIEVSELVVETDCKYTAWAHDKLGACADAQLRSCFDAYSERMFAGAQPPTNWLKAGAPTNWLKAGARSPEDAPGMYLLSPTLERAQRLQREIVAKVAAQAAAPALALIDAMYLVAESKLHYELLYNADYLVGPKGPLARSCRLLPHPFKLAVFVETFFAIVHAYVRKAAASWTEPCEAVIFDALAIWDSVLDFFDVAVNPAAAEEECVRLVGEALDRVKFTANVDLAELAAFRAAFAGGLFAAPKRSDSLLAQYAYACLAYLRPDPGREPAAAAELPLDRHAVWLDGERKKRMLVFGNVILFFRDNSLLQPVGFVAFDAVYAVLAPHTLAQLHPSVQILENNSENDSFSCGTSDSSRLESPASAGGAKSPAADADGASPAGRLPNAPLDLAQLARYAGAAGCLADRRRSFSLPRGNLTARTRYSTASRGSSLLDNLRVWGWQIRLELFDGCALDPSPGDLVLDMEFASPDHRRFWERELRARLSPRAQAVAWPYHTFFFDSI